MLYELPNPRQIEGDGYRRIFMDKYFDIYIWYEDKSNDEILGFQMCYNKNSNHEKALTWYKNKGYSHQMIDSGESNILGKQAPTMTGVQASGLQRVIRRFNHASENIDPIIKEFLKQKFMEYENIIQNEIDRNQFNSNLKPSFDNSI